MQGVVGKRGIGIYGTDIVVGVDGSGGGGGGIRGGDVVGRGWGGGFRKVRGGIVSRGVGVGRTIIGGGGRVETMGIGVETVVMMTVYEIIVARSCRSHDPTRCSSCAGGWRPRGIPR